MVTAAELVARARALQPVLKERAAAADEARRLPAETIRDFQDAGFFKILQPERWGGYEMDPQVFFDVQMALAEACMSSGWVYGILAVHNFQLGLFDLKAQEEVWSTDPATLIASTYQPVGKVTRVDGGFRLSGRWSFSSGCDHGEWMFLGSIVPSGRGRAIPRICAPSCCRRATTRSSIPGSPWDSRPPAATTSSSTTCSFPSTTPIRRRTASSAPIRARR